MKRNTLNFVVDALTMLALLGVVFTGLVVKFVLPQGSPRGGLALFGAGRHEWGEVHFWFTVAMGALLLVHLAMHWTWTCATIARVLGRRKSGTRMTPAWERNVMGVCVLAILIGGMTLLVNEAKLLVRTGESVQSHEGRARDGRGREARLAEGDEAEAGEAPGAGERRPRRGQR